MEINDVSLRDGQFDVFWQIIQAEVLVHVVVTLDFYDAKAGGIFSQGHTHRGGGYHFHGAGGGEKIDMPMAGHYRSDAELVKQLQINPSCRLRDVEVSVAGFLGIF